MPTIVTAALLLSAAAALAILRFVRPKFRFSWLLGIAATAAAWISTWFWIPQLPFSLEIPLWRSAGSSNSFATFAASQLSWPLALCLVTVAAAVLLTAPARSNFPSPSAWALCLVVTGLGVLAIAAEDPLTLVLFWAALDLLEAGVVLGRTENRFASRQVPFAFAVRLGSMALVLLALVLGDPIEGKARFVEIETAGSLLLPAAALLRLTAFSVPWPATSTSPRQDEVGTTLHLTAGVAAVAFLAQLSPRAPGNSWGLSALCAGAALYAGWMWLRAPDQHSARPVWIMGTGSLAIGAALRGNPAGVAAWCGAMLLAGSALVLTTRNQRWINQGMLLGLWICSSLPFSLTAVTWLRGDGAVDWTLPALLVAQAFLLAGLFHRARSPEFEPAPQLEMASLRGIYSVGAGLPIILGVVLGFWGWPGAFQFGAPLAAAAAIPVAVALAWAKRRFALLNPVPTNWIPPAWGSVLSAVQLEMARLQRALQLFAEAITRTMEGEAGIMWSLLFLVLFVSLIASRMP